MTSLQRLGAEALGALLLAGTFLGWWRYHDHAEQLEGAQVCVKKYTITQSAAAADNTITEAQHAQILSTVVKTYDDKIKFLAASNADLAQRVRDFNAALRPSAMPGVAGSSVRVPSCANDAAPGPGDIAEAGTLEVCAANAIELNAIREAWKRLAESKPIQPGGSP
jgi:hypothetical protein